MFLSSKLKIISFHYGQQITLRTLLTKCYNPAAAISIQEARTGLKELVGSSKSWNEARDTSVLDVQLANSQADLPKKQMTDSYREACIPIGSDHVLRNNYVNFHNTVRMGKIMEDLDTMAVWIGYTHNKQDGANKSPLSIVTALVDRIDTKADAIKPDADVILRGHATWVGSSSMEVTMNVEQEENGKLAKCLEAQFLMVARDPMNKRKAFVNPLLVTTPEEQKIFDEGEQNKMKRELEKQESLLKQQPSEQESLTIHQLFLKTLDEKAKTFKTPVKPAGSEWMERTLLKNVIICFPEQRNLYNKIFGGYLMRVAFELGWANALSYSKSRIYLVAVDDIMFQKPVEIGDLLYLSSQIVYTEGPFMQVKVHAEVMHPVTGVHETTNIFHYTFTTKQSDVRTVMPKSYAEYMMYLDGKRHFEQRKLTGN